MLLLLGLLNLFLAAPLRAATRPADASNLSAFGVSSSQINLTWQDNSTNEAGFKIERAPTAGGRWKTIATVGANAVSYANTNLSAATTYYYRVRAYIGKTYSA